MTTFLATSFQAILSFLLIYKYAALFVIAFASSVALPIPASAALAAAGGFSSQGFMDIYLVLIVTCLGSIAGDMLGFGIARRYGEEFLHKIIFVRHIMRSKSYHRVRDYLNDFAPSLIFFSRFLTEVSPITNIMSGLTNVSTKTFFIFALLGEAAYTLIYGLAGFFLGSQWENNINFIYKAGYIMLAIGLTINLVNVLMYKMRKKKMVK